MLKTGRSINAELILAWWTLARGGKNGAKMNIARLSFNSCKTIQRWNGIYVHRSDEIRSVRDSRTKLL